MDKGIAGIVDLLNSANACLGSVSARPWQRDRVNDLLSAAWRLADAGALLRAELESVGVTEGCGLDKVTGRGALLSRFHGPRLSAAEAAKVAAADAKGVVLRWMMVNRAEDGVYYSHAGDTLVAALGHVAKWMGRPAIAQGNERRWTDDWGRVIRIELVPTSISAAQMARYADAYDRRECECPEPGDAELLARVEWMA